VSSSDAPSSPESDAWRDEKLVLSTIQTLLDQLQLDPEHSLNLHSDFGNDLGLDSLAQVELCDLLERSFDVTLPDEVFLTATTPVDWLTCVRTARGDARQYAYAPFVRSSSLPPPKRGAKLQRFANVAARRVRDVARRRRPTSHASGDEHPSTVRGARALISSLLYCIYAWTLLVPFGVSIFVLASLPMTQQQRSRIARSFAVLLCRALGITLHLEGSLSTGNGPYVIAANHSSFVDALALYALSKEPLVFVSSIELERQLFLGRILKGFGCLFVERGRAERSAASVEMLITAIKSGKRLVIFPEGSISAHDGLRVFHLGAFETAVSSPCPVIPVGIRGTGHILRAGSYRPHPGAVRVLVGQPIVPEGSAFSDRVALRDAVRQAIARLSGQPEIGGS
jgi:acyl carrier protein